MENDIACASFAYNSALETPQTCCWIDFEEQLPSKICLECVHYKYMLKLRESE